MPRPLAVMSCLSSFSEMHSSPTVKIRWRSDSRSSVHGRGGGASFLGMVPTVILCVDVRLGCCCLVDEAKENWR